MFDTLRRGATLCALIGAAVFVTATPSFAQVTEAQKDAVKSACRSDFMAHCSSVTPGGEAALQCLGKNMSSLSAGCAERRESGRGSCRTEERAGQERARQDRGRASSRAEVREHGSEARRRTQIGRRLPGSQRARRSTPSRAPAAAIIQKFARACRPAAHRRWNAWKRTRPRFRPAAARRLRQPAAALRLLPRAALLRRPVRRLRRRRS